MEHFYELTTNYGNHKLLAYTAASEMWDSSSIASHRDIKLPDKVIPLISIFYITLILKITFICISSTCADEFFSHKEVFNDSCDVCFIFNHIPLAQTE